MPWSPGRVTDELIRLIDNVPVTFQWYTGITQPPCPTQGIIFWEDSDADVGKIIMRRGHKTYVITGYQSEQENQTTIYPDAHAHRHATGGSSLADVGDDPLGPYTFTWVNEHTFSPTSAAYTPITVDAAALQSADLLRIRRDDGSRVFTVDNDSSVGINEDNPLAYLVVQAGTLNVLGLTPYLWLKGDGIVAGDVTGGLSNGNALVSWTDSSGNNRHLSSPSGTILYYTSIVDSNGKPAVLFSKGSSVPPLFASIGGATHTLSNYTVYHVWKRESGTTGNELELFGNGLGTDFFKCPNAYTLTPFDSNAWRHKCSDTGGFDTYSPDVFTDSTDPQSFHVFSMVKSGTAISSLSYYKDGTFLGTASGNTLGNTHWSQFYSRTGLSFAGGYLLEVIVFASAHDPIDRASVESYLAARYGLSGGSGSSSGVLPLQYWQDASGNVKAQVSEEFYLGLNVDPAVRLHVLDTAEQFRLAYDSTSYMSTTVDAGGSVVLTATDGSLTPTFRFNRFVGIGTTPAVPLHIVTNAGDQHFRVGPSDTNYFYTKVASDGGTTFSTVNGGTESGTIGFTFADLVTIGPFNGLGSSLKLSYNGTIVDTLALDAAGTFSISKAQAPTSAPSFYFTANPAAGGGYPIFRVTQGSTGSVGNTASTFEVTRASFAPTFGLGCTSGQTQYIRFVADGITPVTSTSGSGILLQDLTNSGPAFLWRQYANKSFTHGTSTVPAKWQLWGAGIDTPEVTAPGTPDANHARLYAKDRSGVSALFWKDDAGNEYDLTGVVSGGGSAQPINTDLTEIAAVANVRGDLLVTNSGPTWVALPLGTTGQFVKSDGSDAVWADLQAPEMADPTANAANAGKIWRTVASAGVEQLLKTILKSASDTYGVVILAGGGP